jgi:hypothetical protein
MKTTCVVLAALLAVPTSTGSLAARQRGSAASPRESRVPTGTTSLYARDIGRGQPLLVLHGGPDFDHGYLLADLDRLASAFRLIYYDYLEKLGSTEMSRQRALVESAAVRHSASSEADSFNTGCHARRGGILGGRSSAPRHILQNPASLIDNVAFTVAVY